MRQIYSNRAYNIKKFNICSTLKIIRSRKVKVKTGHQGSTLHREVMNFKEIKISTNREENF